MKKNYLLILVLLIFQLLSFSQTNNPAPYCLPSYSNAPCNQPGPSNAGGNTVNDFINGFVTAGAVVNISNMNTGCNGMANNYIYYCQHNLQVNPGAVITCSLQSGNVYAQGFSIFIDWNQDAVFQSPAERVGSVPGVPAAGTWGTTSFTVPANQAGGIYRMRVRCAYAQNGGPADPCINYFSGECEDYNVYVGNSSGTPLSLNPSNNSPICAGQSVTLSANSTGASSFNWTGPLSYTSNVQNPVLSNVTASMAGTYYVAVTSGTCPVLAGTYVGVKPVSSLTVTSNINPVCAGSNATLTGNTAGSASSYTWSNGSNTNNTVVSPTITTTYTLSVSNNTCTTTMPFTQSVSVCSGIEAFLATASLPIVSPNPFSNELQLTIDGSAKISIYNFAGQLVYEVDANQNIIIATEQFEKGIYFLSVAQHGQKMSVKLLKTN